MKIRFTLNGEKTEIDAPPDRRVVDILREDLGLTGTKEGCGIGECGACTILVGDTPRLSCLMLAAQLEGLDITTVEGLGANGQPNPLQEAFVRCGAIQCGFCTPGMLMAATALIRRNPYPSRTEIREALSGNLCRCTGYQKIVDAVEAATRATADEEIS